VSRRGLAIVVFLQFAALLAVCLFIGDNGWDDGAITLAFARTFAQHGRVALTSHSEIVEGFSTVSWFLLNALVALARPSFQAAILAAQVLSALCICASTVLLARSCALLGLDKLFSHLTVIAFAAWGCSFGEASNGMEMGLLAAAFLLMVNELLSPRPRLVLLVVGVVLAVTTRFEALAYVGPLALGVLLARQRRAFWVIALTTVAVVFVLTACRLAVFSDVVPNTYWAKRWPPYAEFDLVGRLIGAFELPSFFLVPFVLLGVLLRTGFSFASGVRERRQAFLLLGFPVLGAMLVGGLVGKHWGYEGRMPYFAFPLLLLLFSLTFSPWVRLKRTKLRVAVAIGACLCSVVMSMKGFPSGEMDAAFHGGTFGVSPHTYAESAQVFRRIARAADLQRPTILTPDVGGLALCCDEFRIVGLDLLSNRMLARRGPFALADVLASESPEMVEAHWEWASSGKLYELPYFRAHYLPAFAGGTKLWLRRDVAEAIESKGRGCRLPADNDELKQALDKHRYANHDTPDDRKAFTRPGVVFALNQADAAMANLCR
jgi:MFS family permease